MTAIAPQQDRGNGRAPLRAFGRFRFRPAWKQIVCAAALLGIASEVAVVVRANRQRERAGKQIVALTNERRMISASLHVKPHDTEQHVDSEISRASHALGEALNPFRGSAAADDPSTNDPVAAYLGLAQSVAANRSRAAAAEVGLRADEYFGFARHRHQGPAPGLVQAVYRQRRLIEDVLVKLYAARPAELLSVRRPAPPEAEPMTSSDSESDYFSPHSRTSDIGLLDAEMIRVKFAGENGSLRRFLNEISLDANAWLAVRDVEVAPVKSRGQADAAPSNAEFTVTIEQLSAKPPTQSAAIQNERYPSAPPPSVQQATCEPIWPEPGGESKRGLFTPLRTPVPDTRSDVGASATRNIDEFVAGLRILAIERRQFRVQLGGWVGDASDRRALLVKTGTPETRIVSVGQRVHDWQVELHSLSPGESSHGLVPFATTAVISDLVNGRQMIIGAGDAWEDDAGATVACDLGEPRKIRAGETWNDGGFSVETVAVAAADGCLTLRVTRIDAPEESRTTVLKLDAP